MQLRTLFGSYFRHMSIEEDDELSLMQKMIVKTKWFSKKLQTLTKYIKLNRNRKLFFLDFDSMIKLKALQKQ